MITGQQQGTVSTKELSYITDCLKNEELLAKIAAQGVAESQNPQLKQKLSQIAQDRLQNTDQLLRTLQQQSQTTR
ncbi:spore coat protein [Paenibacillus elgii]